VLEEMRDIHKNLSMNQQNSTNLRYEMGKSDSFSGNYSFEIRKSFFNYSNEKEVPCGFLKELPIKHEGLLLISITT
jgi:Protein of unknown function (DUF616)